MLRGDDVADLQRRLNALGFDAGRADGILGPETEAAVRRFQRDAGLAADAVCGPATTAALERLGSFAEGSVATVREREALRRDPRRLGDRVCFLVVDPELMTIGTAVAHELRALGTVVAGPEVAAPDRAAEANRFGADLFLALGSGAWPGVRCAFFAAERVRSEGGFAIATRARDDVGGGARRSRTADWSHVSILAARRRWRPSSASSSRDDPVTATALCARVADLAAAIVEGLRRGVETPVVSP